MTVRDQLESLSAIVGIRNLSPYSTYLVWVGLFTEKGVQSPGDLDGDTAET